MTEIIRMEGGNPEGHRPDIKAEDSLQDMMVKMSEGNPGGLNVALSIVRADGPLVLLDFDDMNIRGSQLWVAFKDFAKGDIKLLITAARERSPDLIKAVNAQCHNTGGFVAVKSGASSKRPAMVKP